MAGGGQRGVFGAVVSERLSGAVGLEAVGLDDDAVLGPVEVGFAVAVVGDVEGVVGLGLGEAGSADEVQELGFPFVLRPFGVRLVACARIWVPLCPLALARTSVVARWS